MNFTVLVRFDVLGCNETDPDTIGLDVIDDVGDGVCVTAAGAGTVLGAGAGAGAGAGGGVGVATGTSFLGGYSMPYNSPTNFTDEKPSVKILHVNQNSSNMRIGIP